MKIFPEILGSILSNILPNSDLNRLIAQHEMRYNFR